MAPNDILDQIKIMCFKKKKKKVLPIYYQYSLPKQLVEFSQQVTEILPKFPHLLKNTRAEQKFTYTDWAVGML